MFVAPEAPAGSSAAVLDALEAAAKAEDVRIVRLETGVRQPEALGLYRRPGSPNAARLALSARSAQHALFEKRVG